MKRIDEFCLKFADRLIWIAILAYILAFGYLSFLKYHSFSYFDWDLAGDVSVLWNSVHGRFLYYPFLEQPIFGAHLYLFIFLIIPVYAIYQHPVTLLFLQTLFLGLAAYPLYLIAKSKLDKMSALAISLAYLLYPSLGYINLFETHFDSYAVFLLFFAFYYFEKNRFNIFLIFILLALSCKENVSMVIFMFGIYSLLRRKSKRWVLVPLMLGALWFFVSVKLIIPYFAKDAGLYKGGFIFSAYYEHLGSGIFEMAKTILFHPLYVAQYAFESRKILYIIWLFLPTGFMGLLSPAVLLFTVPVFMQNLLSSGGTHAQIFYQYTAEIIPFIFLSVIFTFKKLMNNKVIYANRGRLVAAFLIFPVIGGLYLKAPQLFFAGYVKNFQIDDLSKVKDKMISAIPKDASVIATFQFLPKLAQRHNVYSMHFVSKGFKMLTHEKYQAPSALEYAMVDFNEPAMLESFFPPEAAANLRNFIKDNNLKVLKAVDDVVLFKRDYEGGSNLCEPADNPRINNVVNANIGNKIIFLGYNIDRGKSEDGRILHFTYYWKRTADPCGNLAVALQFLDDNNKVIFAKAHSFGYRIYPPDDLPKDQIIKEDYFVLMPHSIKPGMHGMKMILFYLDNGKESLVGVDLGKITVD